MVKLRRAVSIAEMVAVSNSKGARVGWSPYGYPGQGVMYAGRAAPWKLVRKAAGEGLAEFLRRLSGVNAGVADGLTSAIRVSVDAKGAGVALVQTMGGALKVMPLKSANQSIGRPGVVDGRAVDRVAVVLAQAPTYSGLIPAIQGYAPAVGVPA